MSADAQQPEADAPRAAESETRQIFDSASIPRGGSSGAGGAAGEVDGLTFLEELVRGRHSLCKSRGRKEFGFVAHHSDPVRLHVEAIELSRDGCDAYFGTQPVREDLAPGQRGGLADVVDVGLLCFDFDWADDSAHVSGELPDEATTRRLLGIFPCQPSIIVGSGHGLHGYWLLDEPIPVEKAAPLRDLFLDRLKGHGLAVEGGDFARVLGSPTP